MEKADSYNATQTVGQQQEKSSIPASTPSDPQPTGQNFQPQDSQDVKCNYLQSLSKSLGEIRNHTKKYDFRDFRPAVPQPPQQSYNREPGSRYSTHIRATWGIHILKNNCAENRRDSQRFWTRQDRRGGEICIGNEILGGLGTSEIFECLSFLQYK